MLQPVTLLLPMHQPICNDTAPINASAGECNAPDCTLPLFHPPPCSTALRGARAAEFRANFHALARGTAPTNAPASDTAPTNAPANDTAPTNAPANGTAPTNASFSDIAPTNAPANDIAPTNAPANDTAPANDDGLVCTICLEPASITDFVYPDCKCTNRCVELLCNVSQCVVMCRTALQCVAVCRTALQCVAMCRNVSNCVAVCCRPGLHCI